MTVGESTYALRFVQNRENDMFVQFKDNETARGNLAVIIPRAVGQGFLPEGCSADGVELIYDGNSLNLDLPLKEQGIPEYGVLVLAIVSEVVMVAIRFKSDKSDWIMKSVAVNPKEVLRDELKDFSDQLQAKYKFHGRKFRKYRLRLKGGKLDLDKSMASQGMKNDIEVEFDPRIRFEWPPGFYWPPGPYTTYLLGASFVAVVVALIYLYHHAMKREYYVKLRCKQECTFRYIDGDTVIHDNPCVLPLGVGDHSVKIYPKEYPIFTEVIKVKPSFTGKDTVRLMPFDAKGKFRESNLVDITIIGSQHETRRHIPKGPDVLINGFRHTTNHYRDAMIQGLRLPRGLYEIEFDIPENRLREISFGGSLRSAPDSLLFDLNDPEFLSERYIHLFYSMQN